MKKTGMSIIMIAMAFVAGCGKESASDRTERNASHAVLPAELVVATLPGTPVSPFEARTTVKAGDKVLISGNIAGRKDPFVNDRAMFMLVGMELAMCGEKCGTKCPTPWDLCCNTPDEIIKHAATIQLVDSTGTIVKASLAGHGGIKPGSKVTVSGVVEQVDEHVFVVNARNVAFAQARPPAPADACCPH